MVNRACWAQSSEGPARTDQACRDVVEFARKRGLEELVTTAECVRVEALWLGGKWSAALELAEHMMPRLEAEEDVWDLLQLKVQTSLLLLDSGRVSSARPLVEWASSSGQASIVEFDAITLAAEARLAFAEGDTSGAHDSLTRWAELIYNPQDATQTVLAVIGVRLALGLGDLRLADRIAQTHTGFQALHDLAQQSMESLLAEGRSHFDGAATGFVDAAARWHDFGVPYEEAHALLGQGRCLVALGRARRCITTASAGARGLRPARSEAGARRDRPVAREGDAVLTEEGRGPWFESTCAHQRSPARSRFSRSARHSFCNLSATQMLGCGWPREGTPQPPW